jgi:hypothetical protein
MRANNLLLVIVIAGYMLGPQIQHRVLPLLGSFRGLTMHLDPDEVDHSIEDRRGRGGGGGDLGRLGPPQQPGGQGGGMPPPPWDQAGNDDGPPRGGPGGRGGGARGGGAVACWDSVERRRVDMSLCDGPQGDGGRRR